MMLFTLIFMRMSGFILLNPIYGRKQIPALVKSGLIMILSVCVYSFSADEVLPVYHVYEYALLALKEFFVGFVLGFVMQLFEFAITFAGSVIDFQMGLSMATVYDPQSNSQIALTGNIWDIYYILLFFAVDGHLVLMKILLTSAQLIPYGQVAFGPEISEKILTIFSSCVVLGLKFAFPIIAIQFITEIAAGILMKVIPQINIFVINIQLKVVVGLMMLLFLVSPMAEYIGQLLNQMLNTLTEVLKLL